MCRYLWTKNLTVSTHPNNNWTQKYVRRRVQQYHPSQTGAHFDIAQTGLQVPTPTPPAILTEIITARELHLVEVVIRDHTVYAIADLRKGVLL